MLFQVIATLSFVLVVVVTTTSSSSFVTFFQFVFSPNPSMRSRSIHDHYEEEGLESTKE
jgi:hypothetical protein